MPKTPTGKTSLLGRERTPYNRMARLLNLGVDGKGDYVMSEDGSVALAEISCRALKFLQTIDRTSGSVFKHYFPTGMNNDIQCAMLQYRELNQKIHFPNGQCGTEAAKNLVSVMQFATSIGSADDALKGFFHMALDLPAAWKLCGCGNTIKYKVIQLFQEIMRPDPLLHVMVGSLCTLLEVKRLTPEVDGTNESPVSPGASVTVQSSSEQSSSTGSVYSPETQKKFVQLKSRYPDFPFSQLHSEDIVAISNSLEEHGEGHRLYKELLELKPTLFTRLRVPINKLTSVEREELETIFPAQIAFAEMMKSVKSRKRRTTDGKSSTKSEALSGASEEDPLHHNDLI